MIFNYKSKWLNERALKRLPVSLKRNLIDNCSLTKRIYETKASKINHISSKFILSNKFNLCKRKYIYKRTVVLKRDLNEPIYATSYISATNLKGSMNYIKYLGNKSLATILYKRWPFSKQSVSYNISNDVVKRKTLYTKKHIKIIVEENFPINNSYRSISLFNCRKNFINGR